MRTSTRSCSTVSTSATASRACASGHCPLRKMTRCGAPGGRLACRVARLMERRGLGREADPSDADPLASTQPRLAGLAADSVRGLAPGGGRPARRGDRIDPDDLSAPTTRRCAAAMGFTLHADVAVPARDRRRLERFCRYVARPPVATNRLERLPDGRLLYHLRHRWRDGTTQIVFEPHQLLGRLVPLIPAPPLAPGPLPRRPCPLRRLARSGGPGRVSPGQARAARSLPERAGRGDWPRRPAAGPPTAPLRLDGSTAPCVRSGCPGVPQLRRADANPRRHPSARDHPRHSRVSGPAVARPAHRPRSTRPPGARAVRLVARKARDWPSTPAQSHRRHAWRRSACVHPSPCDPSPTLPLTCRAAWIPRHPVPRPVPPRTSRPS